MAVQARILRLSVHENKHGRTAADAAQLYRTRRSGGHSVAHHSATRHEQSRHKLVYCGQNRLAEVGGELFAADGGYGHGQMSHVGGVACTRDHHLGDVLPDGIIEYSCFGTGRRRCHESHAYCRQSHSFCFNLSTSWSISCSRAGMSMRCGQCGIHCPQPMQWLA